MGDLERGDFLRRLALMLIILAGVVTFFAGQLTTYTELSVLGIFLIGMPILLYIGYLMVEAQRDEGMVIEADPRRFRPPGVGPPDEAALQDGPGTCPACGGALFYGRINCPHCSESIFLDTGEVPPPEL